MTTRGGAANEYNAMDCIDCESARQCCDWLFVLACSKAVGVEV